MNVEEFYDNEAIAYDQLRWTGSIGRYVHQQYEKLVSASVPIRADSKYLEVGCGTGRFTVPFAAKGVDLTAVDISDEMLAITKAKLDKAISGGGRVNLVKADARATHFPSEAFDVVFSFNVINHVPKYELVISEVARLLKPGGTFVVGYPSLWSLYLPYAMLVNLTRRSIRRGVYTRWPSTPALVRQAGGLGMDVERMHGMFHCPTIKNTFFSNSVAALLRGAGRFVETGASQAFASIRIVTFRKNQPFGAHADS
jgi:SAM-dependent methyltransferase